MQATRFILIRHAETAANRELRYIGSRDDPLTEHGHRQAQLLADALATLPIRAVYSSPRHRARDTAQPIAERLDVPVELAEDLRENSFGAWEGMSRAEVLAHSSQYAAQLAAWEADTSLAPPEGESMANMSARVTDFALGCLARHAGQTIVLVSHVGPVKALIATTLGTSLAIMRSMFLDSATISVVDWSDRQRILRLFNSHAHLGWTSARWM